MTDSLEERLRIELAPELEVIRRLGHGSVATVYLAREAALKRLVAVKVLRPDVAGDEVARRRFEREAQAAARLNHHNLADVYRVGRLAAGIPYIVMEYIDGRNLADALKATGPMTVADVRTVISGVADALAAAHAKGIIHRDVRPANVLREERTRRVVLTDFGIAAFLESGGESATRLTTVGHRIGDPRYMSPEHLDGEQLTEQADIYSLGVLGYELLTGEGPYAAATRAASLVAHLHGTPRPLRDLRADVDPVLANVLERCLVRNPEQRPRAADISAALARGAISGTPGGASAPRGPLSAFVGELRRRRVWRVGATYAVIAGAFLQVLEPLTVGLGLTLAVQRTIIVMVLAGFPVALALAWAFDVREGRVLRAAAHELPQHSALSRLLPWLGLALSAALAVLAGWLFLSRN